MTTRRTHLNQCEMCGNIFRSEQVKTRETLCDSCTKECLMDLRVEDDLSDQEGDEDDSGIQ